MKARHREMDCYDGCGVMKRTSVPGTRFEGLENEITNMRLGLLIGVLSFVFADEKRYPWIGFHEVNMVSLMSGGCCVTAETGFNPRDTAEDTAQGRGLDVPAVREMFYQAGFRWLVRGDGSRVALISPHPLADGEAERDGAPYDEEAPEERYAPRHEADDVG